MTDTSWQGNYSYSSVVCPRCGKDDQLQRVSTIVDSGTSQTNGVGIGAVVAGAGGRHPVGVATYSSSNVNNLAKRLGGVPEPRFSWIKGFLASWALVSAVLVPVLLSLEIDSPWLTTTFSGVFFAFWGGLVLVIPVVLIGDLFLRPARDRWRQKMAHLRSAYYCHRDDLVVAGDGSGSPEEYVAWCFSRP